VSTGSRLAAFGLIVVGSFGTAYAVGERFPETGAAANQGHSHGHSHSHEPSKPSTATTNARGYQLVTMSAGNIADGLRFRILEPNGEPVTSYTEAHGALLHAVLVRPDISDFQHVHPVIEADGSFTVSPGAPGRWRVIFETQPSSTDEPIVLSTDIDDETGGELSPLPEPDDSVTIEVQGDAITITRTDGHFLVSAPEPLEPYLGQQAHLIAIREGDLAYTHIRATR
jgi:hypothetical protein